MSSEGSGESAYMHILAWAFADRRCDKYRNFIQLPKYNVITRMPIILRNFDSDSRNKDILTKNKSADDMNSTEYDQISFWAGMTINVISLNPS